MNADLKGTLALIGCGKMGGAMLEGWLKSGIDVRQIVVLEPNPLPEIANFFPARASISTLKLRS